MKLHCRVDEIGRREGFERAAMWRHNMVLLLSFTWVGPDAKDLWTLYAWAVTPTGHGGAPSLIKFQPEYGVENRVAKVLERPLEKLEVGPSVVEEGLCLYMDPLRATLEAQALAGRLQTITDKVSNLCTTLVEEKDLDRFNGSARILGSGFSLEVGKK